MTKFLYGFKKIRKGLTYFGMRLNRAPGQEGQGHTGCENNYCDGLRVCVCIVHAGTYRARKDIGPSHRCDSCWCRARKDKANQFTKIMVVMVFVVVFVLCKHACTMPGRTIGTCQGACFHTTKGRRVRRGSWVAGECETRVEWQEAKQKRDGLTRWWVGNKARASSWGNGGGPQQMRE